MLYIRKWVETGKEGRREEGRKEGRKREGGREDRSRAGSGEGGKQEDYEYPQVLLIYHWREKWEGKEGRRKGRGRSKWRKRREGERERWQNCADFPRYGLEIGLWFQAS